MRQILERSPAYRIFLRLRSRLISNERLKSRLRRRGHNLDKALADGTDCRVALFELKLLVSEYFRRNLKGTETTKWVWDLIYQAELGLVDSDDMRVLTENVVPLTEQNFKKAVMGRRSVRQWTAEPLNVDDIVEALDVARWAPSSCNRQAWKFLLVQKHQDKECLQMFTHQTFFKQAPIVVVPLVDMEDYHKEIKHYAYLDSGSVIQTLLLTLQVDGFGACWIGVKHDQQYDGNLDAFQSHFRLSKQWIPVSLIPVGRYELLPKTPPRKDVDDMILDQTD